MTYPLLTTADKGALLDAQKYGKWIAKDASGTLYAYRNKPVKKLLMGEWYDMTWVALNWIYISFIHWEDAEPVNIDLALAQIAEMETAQTPTLPPMTWNERINQTTVEEKVEFLMSFENCANSVNPSFKCYASNDCDECLKKFLNSPYTEGGHR